MVLMCFYFSKISHVSVICRHYFYNGKGKVHIMNFVVIKYFVFG